jgi:hypothetical protein
MKQLHTNKKTTAALIVVLMLALTSFTIKTVSSNSCSSTCSSAAIANVYDAAFAQPNATESHIGFFEKTDGSWEQVNSFTRPAHLQKKFENGHYYNVTFWHKDALGNSKAEVLEFFIPAEIKTLKAMIGLQKQEDIQVFAAHKEVNGEFHAPDYSKPVAFLQYKTYAEVLKSFTTESNEASTTSMHKMFHYIAAKRNAYSNADNLAIE